MRTLRPHTGIDTDLFTLRNNLSRLLELYIIRSAHGLGKMYGIRHFVFDFGLTDIHGQNQHCRALLADGRLTGHYR